MKNDFKIRQPNELESLCLSIRAFVAQKDYDACISPICKAMEDHPHAPEPHNLLGIVLEKKGDHLTAMKHFRAATALDPTYTPANHNLHTYGTFYSGGTCAFDVSDVPLQAQNTPHIVYHDCGIGHIVGKR